MRPRAGGYVPRVRKEPLNDASHVRNAIARWQDLGKPRTKKALYEEARRRGVKGRSTMTKAQLERALSRG